MLIGRGGCQCQWYSHRLCSATNPSSPLLALNTWLQLQCKIWPAGYYPPGNTGCRRLPQKLPTVSGEQHLPGAATANQYRRVNWTGDCNVGCGLHTLRKGAPVHALPSASRAATFTALHIRCFYKHSSSKPIALMCLMSFDQNKNLYPAHGCPIPYQAE